MGVLGVIAAGLFILINPLGQLQKTRDARRKSDLSTLQKTLGQYYIDNGRFPEHSPNTGGPYCTGGTFYTRYFQIFPAGVCKKWGTYWSEYSIVLPKDPRSFAKYAYWASPDGQSYRLYASLERTDDPQICGIPVPGTDNACPGLSAPGVGMTNAAACKSSGLAYVPCNYGVTSSNVTP